MKKSNLTLKKKCESIKLVISDVDGVLTDGGMYYSEKGEVLKKFNTKDGMAVELLLKNRIKTILMTRENSEIVKKRGKKIKVALSYLGVKRKEEKLKKICEKFCVIPSEIAYIGDDVNDLEIIKKVGFSASPSDGIQTIVNNVDYVCKLKGGQGVLREITEVILKYKKL